VLHTAAFVADLKGVGLPELAKTTSDNFYRLFSRAKRPSA
jgi:TatD DNase family protein